LGPASPPVQWITGFFSGLKQSGRGFVHTPLSKAEVKERVEIYLYAPYGLSWPVTRKLHCGV